jgi:hypothetical protein
MSKFTKFAAGSLAALTLVAAVATTSTQAQAGHKGWGIAAGVAAGALIAGAAASHAYGHGYYYGPGYASCKFVPRYDYWGNYIGSKKVCYAY